MSARRVFRGRGGVWDAPLPSQRPYSKKEKDAKAAKDDAGDAGMTKVCVRVLYVCWPCNQFVEFV